MSSLSTADILKLRGAKNKVVSDRAYAALVEKELSSERELVDVATIFLTNRECPFRCLMCDLWKNTLDETVNLGEIPLQIEKALKSFGEADHLKLYNSGNFFDRKAIPSEDYDAIASLTTSFRKVIIESHPKFIGSEAVEFRGLVAGNLEIAMGLETIHPEVLPALNKSMTLDDFRKASSYLRENEIGGRTFVLLRPPYLSEEEGIEWAIKSVEFALESGSGVVAVIPTRAGNGAIDQLEKSGHFEKPQLRSLEKVIDHFAEDERGVVTADLWDLELFSSCDHCFKDRYERLATMNMSGQMLPQIECGNCDDI